jgi:hypothetical protein
MFNSIKILQGKVVAFRSKARALSECGLVLYSQDICCALKLATRKQDRSQVFGPKSNRLASNLLTSPLPSLCCLNPPAQDFSKKQLCKADTRCVGLIFFVHIAAPTFGILLCCRRTLTVRVLRYWMGAGQLCVGPKSQMMVSVEGLDIIA